MRVSSAQRGTFTLKFWLVDPGVVLQKLVIKTDDVPSRYLGPPESPYLPVGEVPSGENTRSADGEAR